ncbi:MAG TPA: porin [Steroidobacteraceae bacterium]
MSALVHGASRSLLIALGALVLLPPLPAVAQSVKGTRGQLTLEQRLEKRLEEQDARIKDLERRLEAQPQREEAKSGAAPAAVAQQQQEQQIKVLERRLEIQQEDAKSAAAAAPVVKATPTGFSIASSDGNYLIRLRGIIQADDRYFFSNSAPPSASTFLLRRVRPIIEGTLGKIFDYRFVPDFGVGKSIIQDAYVVGHFEPFFNVTAGKFKSPFGIERLQSAYDIRFAERALPNNIVPNRDIGVQIGGDLFGGALSYAIALQNGVPDGGSSDGNTTPDADNNNDKDVALRLFAQPFKSSDVFALRGLGLGIAAMQSHGVGSTTNTLLGTYKTPGQQTLFSYRTGASATFADGERFRWSPQLYYYSGAFGLLGEFVGVSQGVTRTVGTTTRHDTLNHSSWQLQLGYVLTGEDESYKSPIPQRPYEKGSLGWGALELVARYSELKFDAGSFTGGANSFADPSVAIARASAWAAGLNWYLTQNTKVVLDYELTKFRGGAAAGRDRPDEKTLFSRLQISF